MWGPFYEKHNISACHLQSLSFRPHVQPEWSPEHVPLLLKCPQVSPCRPMWNLWPSPSIPTWVLYKDSIYSKSPWTPLQAYCLASPSNTSHKHKGQGLSRVIICHYLVATGWDFPNSSPRSVSNHLKVTQITGQGSLQSQLLALSPT